MKTLFFLAAVHVLCAGSTAITHSNYSSSGEAPDSFKKQPADTSTLNGKWYLLPILPSDTATGKIPFLEINLATAGFSGNTGCNNMQGSFQKTDTSFSFEQNMVTTKMMCTGYNEAAFIKNMLRTNHYKIENGELLLLFDATELSRWTRKPGGRPKINKA